MKKLPKYKTQDNANLFPQDFEINVGPSMTIQNDTYSLRDIIEKFSREYPHELERRGYYDIDDDSEDFDDVDITRNGDFDLSDAHDLREKIREKEQNMSSFRKKSDHSKNGLPDQVVEQNSTAQPSDV